MDIETKLTNLENLVNALSKKIDNIKFYQDADNAGMRQTEGNQSVQIDANTTGVKDNSDGIFDIAEAVGEESDSLYELAEMVAELEERVTVLEEK